jgi:uncharacterized membrane protein YagU involved in acid resistance
MIQIILLYLIFLMFESVRDALPLPDDYAPAKCHILAINRNLERKRRIMAEKQKRMRGGASALLFCVMTGFYAGVIWGGFRWLLYTVKFTGVLPGFMADPFFRKTFMVTGWGHSIGLLLFIVFSMLASLLYKLILGHVKGPWAGLVYGFLWWGVLFLGAGPLLGMTRPVQELGWNTLIAECCVFTVWGLFIGYTIAFEFTDEASREPDPAGGTLLKT